MLKDSFIKFIIFLIVFLANTGMPQENPESRKEPYPTPKKGIWKSDNGNGTYKNPVIFADYSDPDVIRVGNDYFMTASSFSHFPGLPILHSRDMINWRIVNYAVNKYPVDSFDKPQHGNGIWAPSIRYHKKEFYIYFGDPDEGIFMTKTKNPFGKWSELKLIKKAKGWIDPCPFWDDDGNAYLVHAWAKSRAGFNSILTMNKMSPAGDAITDTGVMVFDGRKNHPTMEGPKLYKRNGYYYIFAPAGGVKPGWQTVLRSKNIYGPYEDKIVLEQGKTKINGPHQGAWVETPTGESWFYHFQDRNAYGRIVHLQPVKWVDDYPVIGDDPDKNGTGEPVENWKKPDLKSVGNNCVLETSDEFNSGNYGLQWQWQANYSEKWFSAKSRKGWLRLNSQKVPVDNSNLYDTPSLLMQKLPAPEFVMTTKLEFNPKSSGEKSGVMIFGMSYAYMVIEKSTEGFKIIVAVCNDASKKGKEEIKYSVDLPEKSVFLRVSVKEEAVCRFSYSLDGENYTDTGIDFTATAGRWVGAKTGIFSIASEKTQKPGYADFDWVRFSEK